MNLLMDLVNKKSLKRAIPDVATGDVVKVSQKITEGAKTRIQVFEGMVIERSGGNSVTASITVRKIASGVGVEKKFLLNSPNIEKIEVLRSSKVRRKKIFFLRNLTGKAAKLRGKQRKMMEEIGLKADEVLENAENTEDLVQPSPEESSDNENQEAPSSEATEEKESTESVAEEPKTEDTTEEKPEEATSEDAKEESKEESKDEEGSKEE